MEHTDILPQLPYDERVMTSGREPKQRANAKRLDTGFFSTLGSEFNNNTLFMSAWRWGHIRYVRRTVEHVPDGWSPEQDISGFFHDYSDYLGKARSPDELRLRKEYVVQRINYERRMAQTSGVLSTSGQLVGYLIDPFTLVLGGIVGRLGGSAANIALRGGAGRLAAGAVHGAVTGASLDLATTSAKRALDSDVARAEYHVMYGAMFGSALGLAGGALSDAASFARFKLEHNGVGAKQYPVYRAYDKEMTMLRVGGKKHLSASDQLHRQENIRQAVDMYLLGELPSGEYRGIDIGGQASKASAISRAMGVQIDLCARGVNYMKSMFSNQMNMLTSQLATLRVAGMKLQASPTYESALIGQVGTASPVVQNVAMRNTICGRRMDEGLSDGYKLAIKSGFHGDKRTFMSRAFGAYASKELYEKETNAGVRHFVDEYASALRESADYKFQQCGFEFQKRAKEKFLSSVEYANAKLRPLGHVLEEHDGKYSAVALVEETVASSRITQDMQSVADDALAKLNESAAEYTGIMSGGLDRAVEKMGGNYYQKKLNKYYISSHKEEALDILTKNRIAVDSRCAQRILDMSHADMLSEALEVGHGDLNKTWSAYKESMCKHGANPDIYDIPSSIDALARRDLPLSRAFLESAREEAQCRVDDAVQGVFGMRSDAGARRVSLRHALDRAQEGPELRPRGSAKMRNYEDDFEIIRTLLDDNMLENGYKYIEEMHSDAAMIESFGDEHADMFTKKIISEYADELKKISLSGKSPEEILSLSSALKEEVESGLQSMETMINHVKGFTSVDWGNINEFSAPKRLISIASNWNVARYLSDSIFAQLQDQANVALRMEGWRSFGRSISNFAKQAYSPALRGEYAQMIRDFGVASDLFMTHTRADTLVSAAHKTGLLSGIEGFSHDMAQLAVKVSGTHLLDSYTQCNTAYMTAKLLADIGERVARNGRLSEFQLRFANDYKLSTELLRRVHDQVIKHGETTDNIFSLNISKWEDAHAQSTVRSIIHDNATKATMVPGADLPAIFKSPVGKFLLQFKSFSTATFNRMFVPSLESGNAAMVNTIAQCMIMDTAGKWMKSFGKIERPQYDDPVTGKRRDFTTQEIMMKHFSDSVSSMDWAAWAFDPTGIFQAIKSPNQPASQLGGTMNSFVRDFGYTTRYASKKLTGDNVTNMERRAAWRMLPFQNYFLLRAGISAWKRILPKEEMDDE